MWNDFYCDEVMERTIQIVKERINRIIEEEYDRRLDQGHTFSSEYGLHVSEIPVDKVKEILK